MQARGGPRLAGLAALWLLTGCAGLSEPMDWSLPASAEACPSRIPRSERIDRRSDGHDLAPDTLLPHLRLGLLLQACGRYRESSRVFERAKQIADALYTRSISREFASFLISDELRPYPGQNFERAQLLIQNAINYAVAGLEEDALVEARQVDFFLRELDRAQGGRNVYSDDAFASYLSGMLHEEAGNLDDARVSYLKALEAYSRSAASYGVPAPRGLLESAQAVARAHSQRAVAELAPFGPATPRTLPAGTGELVVLHQVGLVPQKEEDAIYVSWGEGWASVRAVRSGEVNEDYRRAAAIAGSIAARESFKVAFPVLVPRPYRIRSLRASALGARRSGRPTLVEDVGAIAMQDLDDHRARIQLRTIARAAVFFAAKRWTQYVLLENGNEEAARLVELVAQLRQIALERADLRQWGSLPDRIQLSSLILPAGRHAIDLDFYADPHAGGRVIESGRLAEVPIREGRRTFVTVRTTR